jgi:Fe-S oxidoreductase
MVCPVGNDITGMIRKEREGMAAAGYAPSDMKHATQRAIEIGSPMGVTRKTFEATVRRAEKEIGMDIPMDVKGADYMMLLSSAEIAQFHEIIPAVAQIFKQAGVSWTFCSEAFEGTNSGIQIGSSEDAAVLIERIVKGAEKLNVKYVISPECGHAYMALRWEGPNLIGRPYPFTVVHILELLDQLQSEGRFTTKLLEKERMTFHDPCQLVRRGGVVEQPRRLMNLIAADFVEMEDHGVMNWCCGGGGGVSAIERAEPLRNKVFERKKKQLEGLNVSTIVTACSNCRNMLDEGLEHNAIDVEVIGLTELLAEHLQQ